MRQTLTWERPVSDPAVSQQYEVFRDGILLESIDSAEDELSYVDLAPPLGPATYTVVIFCPTAGSFVSSVETFVNPDGPHRNVILRLDYGEGLVDSASAIRAALESQGEDVWEYYSIDSMPVCFFNETIFWVVTGTFPDRRALSPAEAAFLTGQLEFNRKVYFEGGDTWGFDAPSSFTNLTGIFGATDGNDSVTTLDGIPGLVDVGSFQDVPYMQDQIGDDSIDDLGGLLTGTQLIWRRGSGSQYGVGVANAAVPGQGNFIAQSWEFGGFGGDQEALTAAYLGFLRPTAPPAATGIFRRGDANADGGIDIADVDFVIRYFFDGGEAPGCFEAADTNSDGVPDIADSIYTLLYLFAGGPPPAPPVFCQGAVVLSSCDEPQCP